MGGIFFSCEISTRNSKCTSIKVRKQIDLSLWASFAQMGPKAESPFWVFKLKGEVAFDQMLTNGKQSPECSWAKLWNYIHKAYK